MIFCLSMVNLSYIIWNSNSNIWKLWVMTQRNIDAYIVTSKELFFDRWALCTIWIRIIKNLNYQCFIAACQQCLRDIKSLLEGKWLYNIIYVIIDIEVYCWLMKLKLNTSIYSRMIEHNSLAFKDIIDNCHWAKICHVYS